MFGTSGLDWQRPQSLYTIVCRPALPRDTTDVMELTRAIWEGDDYVPGVWAEWLRDYSGLLAVAQYGSYVVGLCKLTRFAEGEWWLQGLRVHPAYEGRGIASRLHDYILAYWLQNGSGVIRLSTASFRLPVQHLCDRTGFTKVGEFTPFGAEAEAGAETGFISLTPEAASLIFSTIAGNEIVLLSHGLMDWGWQWASLNAARLTEAAQAGRLWRWHAEAAAEGYLVARADADENALTAELLACNRESLEQLLRDFRRLAASLGYSKAIWLAPLGVDLEPVLAEAAYSRQWEASVYVYEKPHPLRPAALVV